MRYADTGSRDPKNALGTWLVANAVDDGSVVAIRWQTGFFGAGSIAFVAPLLSRLADSDGIVRLVVGSNDGTTPRGDIESLLAAIGPPRSTRQLAIVTFDNAFFHPKTIHLGRQDGSAAAYVGSANLTKSGVESLHIEAGIELDTLAGDDATVLASIAEAVDWWFEGPRDGAYRVENPGDLDALAASGIISVPKPPRPMRPAPSTDAAKPPNRLDPLILAPAWLEPARTPERVEASAPEDSDTPPPADEEEIEVIPEEHWEKKLTRSDAQRKAVGNQRGSITLTQAGFDIDAQTYFRRDFFGAEAWIDEVTRTGEARDRIDIPFATTVLGDDLGVQILPVTYALNREASQANYTTLLHLGPLAPEFVNTDMSGRLIELDRHDDGSYSLRIS